MEIRGARDVQGICLDLMERISKLRETLQHKEFQDYISDDHYLGRCVEILLGLNVSIIDIEHYYQQAMCDIRDNMKDEQENHEKLSFIMQKYFNLYLKNDIIPHIQDCIDCIREEDADDYRVRDLQMDMAKKNGNNQRLLQATI